MKWLEEKEGSEVGGVRRLVGRGRREKTFVTKMHKLT